MNPSLELARRLNGEILNNLKAAFVGKDEIIDLLGVCLVGRREPVPARPARHGQERPRARAGPPPRRPRLRLPADAVHRAERAVRPVRHPQAARGRPGDQHRGHAARGVAGVPRRAAQRQQRDPQQPADGAQRARLPPRPRDAARCRLLMVVGASNRLPEDDALAALFDRFLLRVRCDNVPDERLADVLRPAGSSTAEPDERGAPLDDREDVRQLQRLLPRRRPRAGAAGATSSWSQRLRHAGIPVSDRRAVKLQRLVAASALLCGRTHADRTDLWVLRYIWDTEEQREVIAAIVQDAVEGGAPDDRAASASARRAAPTARTPRSWQDDLDRMSEPRARPRRPLGASRPARAAGRPLPVGRGRASSGRSSLDRIEGCGRQWGASRERGWAVRIAVANWRWPPARCACGRAAVCAAGDGLWLRGERLDGRAGLELRKLPAARAVLRRRRRRSWPRGCRAAGGRLPEWPAGGCCHWLDVAAAGVRGPSGRPGGAATVRADRAGRATGAGAMLGRVGPIGRRAPSTPPAPRCALDAASFRRRRRRALCAVRGLRCRHCRV